MLFAFFARVADENFSQKTKQEIFDCKIANFTI
jgi:hypothetical protein